MRDSNDCRRELPSNSRARLSSATGARDARGCAPLRAPSAPCHPASTNQTESSSTAKTTGVQRSRAILCHWLNLPASRAEDPDQSDDDQIERDDVVQQSRNDQNKNAGD